MEALWLVPFSALRHKREQSPEPYQDAAGTPERARLEPMNLLHLASRNLAGSLSRSVLTIAGVSVAFAAFITLIGLSRGLERSWSSAMKSQGTDVMAVQRRSVDPVAATLDESLAGRISAIPGVAEVAGELIDLVELESGEVILVAGWQQGSYLWRLQPMKRGRLPRPGEEDVVAIGAPLAEVLAKGVGDQLVLDDATFRISGIMGTGDIRSTRFVVLRLPVLQHMLGKEGRVTIFSIRLTHPEDGIAARRTLDRLSQAFPELSFSLADDVANGYFGLRMLRGFAWGTSLVALAMALVMVSTTLLTSMMERAREVALLLAVGWPLPVVIGELSLEGLLITLAGSAAGTALGLAGLNWLAAQPAVLGSLKPEVTMTMIAAVIVATLALGVVAAGFAGWRAARLEVADALRLE